jgi:hypothetical protein
MAMEGCMGTAARQIVVSFGPSNSGLASKVQYTVFDYSGVAVLGPTSAGVVESGVEPGTYLAAPSFDTRWAGRIEWTIAGLPGVAAIDDYGRVLGGFSVAVASFGGDNSGLAASVGLTIVDTAGNVLTARSGAGVQESAQIAGAYWKPTFLAAGWTGYLQWDIAGRPGVVAIEDFGPGVAGVPYPPVTLPERPDTPERQP